MKSTRIFAAVLVAALALSCKSNSDVKVDVELPTHAEVDSVCYLLGINFGSFLKGNDLCDNLSELNMSELKKGMNDFLKAEGNVYDSSESSSRLILRIWAASSMVTFPRRASTPLRLTR